MRYSISQVAKMAGISARTLRHYDDLGLLTPAEVAANGYRWYGRPELRRLQRILLLRDLEVPLPEINTILAGDDEASALRRHLMLVTAERDRLDRIASTLARTVDDLEGRDHLPDAEFFQGLEEGRQRLADTLRQRFGDPAAATLERAAADQNAQWTRSDYDRSATEGRELYARLSRARAARLDPTSREALDLVEEHYEGVRAVWPADPASYHALADLIETEPQQRDIVGADDPDLPAWLAAAIRAYAVHRLGHRPA